MHNVKTARPVAAAFGLFWTSPEGLIVPCESYTINSDGRTTSGDHASAEHLATAFARGDTFLIYESYLNEAAATQSAGECGADYSVRALPAGTFFYDGETLCVVVISSFEEALACPDKARILFDASKGGNVRGITEDHRYELANVINDRAMTKARCDENTALGLAAIEAVLSEDSSVFAFTNTPHGRAIVYGAVMGWPSPSDCVWLIPGTSNCFA